MRKLLGLFCILFMGFQVSAEAQILKELGKVAKEVVRELDKKGHEKEPVVRAGEETSKEKEAAIGATKAAAEKESTNFYKESTRQEIFGKSEGFTKISEDGRYAAASGFQGSRQAFFINGKPGANFDKLHTGTFKFSQRGGHFTYIGERAGECMLVVDGKELENVDCNRVRDFSNRIIFSNDGTVVAYIKELTRESKMVVINGKPGLEFYIISEDIQTIDNDVYYTGASKPEDPYDPIKFYLYKNHKQAYDSPVFTFLTSAEKDLVLTVRPENSAVGIVSEEDLNTGSILYNGQKIQGNLLPHLGMNREWGAIFYTDGQQNFVRWKKQVFSIPKDEMVFAPIEIAGLNFLPAPDKKRTAFITRKGRYRVWVDGKPGPSFEKIKDMRFTGDSKNIIYFANSGGKWFIVINGEERGPFKDVSGLKVSEKGGAYSYFIHEENNKNLYVNGKFVGIGAYHDGFEFSPDGSRYAYVGDNYSLQVDGQEVISEGKPILPSPLPSDSKYGGGQKNYFAFSPTGKLAYTYASGHKENVLVYGDQEVRAQGNASGFRYLTFSPNGDHFAFFKTVPGTESGEVDWQLYINMKPGPVVSKSWGHELAPQPIQFLDNDNIQVIGFLGEDIVSHTVKIP